MIHIIFFINKCRSLLFNLFVLLPKHWTFAKLSQTFQFFGLLIAPLLTLILFTIQKITTYVILQSFVFFCVVFVWFLLDPWAYKRMYTFTYTFLQLKFTQLLIYWCLVLEELCWSLLFVRYVTLAILFFIVILSFFGPNLIIELLFRFMLFLVIFYSKIRNDILNYEKLCITSESNWDKILSEVDRSIRPNLVFFRQDNQFLHNKLSVDKSKTNFPFLIFKRKVTSSVSNAAKAAAPGALQACKEWLINNPDKAAKLGVSLTSGVLVAGSAVTVAFIDQSNRKRDNETQERIRQEDLARAEKIRQEDLAREEKIRQENLAREETIRQENLAREETIRQENLSYKQHELNLKERELIQKEQLLLERKPYYTVYQQKNNFVSSSQSPAVQEARRQALQQNLPASFSSNDSAKSTAFSSLENSQLLSNYYAICKWFS